MAGDMIQHGPNVIHPEQESAVGSRNSLNRDKRDEYAEAKLLVDEEVDKILNHIHAKLPPEVLSRLEVMGSIKGKLHSYFNQSYQNMLNRYLTTVEDEFGKKVRDLIDVEEMRGLNRYAPRPVSYLLDRVGGADKFNTSEVEKSIVNMFGHLHGHIQREMTDLETHTNSLLRRKTDVGAFVRGENAYAIVKCSFRDHRDKPENVYEIKLALNVLDSELISPIYHYQESIEHIIKEAIAKHLGEIVDKELEKINASLVDEGKNELTAEEKIFERINILEAHTSDEESEGSKRYTLLAKKFFDAIEGVQAEIHDNEYDVLGVRENIFKVIQDENIRNRGFNTAVNAITHILDTGKMGYQHLEFFKGTRRAVIREYSETDPDILPDERYGIEIVYYNKQQIDAMREAYKQQLAELDRCTIEVWDVAEAIYVEHRTATGREDWDVISKRLLEIKPPRRSWFSFGAADEETEEPAEEAEGTPHWNEISFLDAEDSGHARNNPTYDSRVKELRARFPLMRDKLNLVFEETNPELRMIVDNRIEFLESEFNRFAAQINPFHLQPGVLVDMDIVSIKRKSATMMNMANVLNEFLSAISMGFKDSAFAEFSRRRSTERKDLSGEFESATGLAEWEEQGEEVFE
ncbi:MAG: cytochrome C oxidase subunit II [Candidatus Lambdaproteobacteria bacterium]|nr:cytochrome C oxidase subunit II [Candidatus Lambdaproteobacteria bacterium]